MLHGLNHDKFVLAFFFAKSTVIDFPSAHKIRLLHGEQICRATWIFDAEWLLFRARKVGDWQPPLQECGSILSMTLIRFRALRHPRLQFFYCQYILHDDADTSIV